ncbi:MAG TPA: sigma 54-interacting transcriptional regulator [Syntrophales bacterium]|jgi:Nif-specific regulatory protein|nr:sigma 54-interacting transcriptional regulator [Syntrophales bacterium]HON22392.1 sigma 54-interacting transcriptional regulator [Syntrophales bacterium]HOU77944.1 sigma 54-interacting transcriptional regulator [Syntrophales bacterium]HPC33213.1 sigma 54-interacting transcriptional regulator [Syntrophales bacterium]HQG34568.1 sigma 54-interacting transcriptional regulator [Syntrophales bacterium]
MSAHTYEELAALHAIAKTLAQPWDLRDQLEQVLGEMNARLGMKRGMISLLDRDTGEAWLEVAHDVKLDGMEITYRRGEGITGKVAQTGIPLAIPNLGAESLFLDRTGARRHLDRNELAFLCVPIMYDSRVVGILSADKGAREVADLDREMALLSSVAELIAKAVHILGLEEENRRLRRLVNSGKPLSVDIIGHSKGMEEVFGLIRHVADSGTTVLIFGETGTGKELVARAIHMNSARSKGPLIQVNCAAIPDTLIESELFGHEKGAFTGALRQHRGRFEEANNGTIFLDEVAELSAAAQAKLLRVLQEKQFQPLGSPRLVTTNARIIAATNRRLEDCAAAGSFRTDLYYRLSVFPIYIPPLRDRGNDIILLADHFVLKYAKEMNKPVKRIATPVIEAFLAHHWPGNVRELENCIERAVLLAEGDTIEMIHLPPSLQIRNREGGEKEAGRFSTVIESQERAMIVEALKAAHGNQSQAARNLGVTKRIIQYKIQKLGIDPWKFRTGRNNRSSGV